MKRTHHVSLLTLAGILLVLASAMPTILQPGVIRDETGRDHGAPPRAASYVDYLYTLGVTDVYNPPDNAHLYLPNAVAVNATGNVYVVDSGNDRVQVFDKTGAYCYTIGTGTPGTGNNQFDEPKGISINDTGHIYVTDSANHRVQVFDNAGIFQYTIGTTGVSGTGPGQFNLPSGVVVNSSRYVYISDSNNFRVQVFDKAGIFQYQIGTGSSGNGNYQFNGVRGVAVNSSGHLYVSDRQNNRVQVFDKAGIYQYTICGNGQGSGNNQFYWPDGVVVNSTNHLYVADEANHRVQVFNNTGIYQYTVGTGVNGNGNDRFSWPKGVAVNSTNHLFVADTQNQRVQVFNNGTPISLTIAINGEASDTNNTIVTLTLSAHDATQMCFSNNGTTYTDWETYGTSKVWTLDNVAGNRTVYFKTKNVHGNSSQITDIITYVQTPTGLSLLIDGGATETNSTSVTLTPSATGATHMCFSNNGTTYTDWEAYGTTKLWMLAGGPGPKRVYFKAWNSTYEASPVSEAITYILPPTGLSISINNGAEDTNNTIVTLTLGAMGATQMCFSNNGTTYTVWETLNPSKVWILDGGPGPKTVYFKVCNSTINATTPVFATINYTLPPTGLSISIDSGAAQTGSTSVTLTLSATGATQMCFSNNGTTYTAWEPYDTTKAWTLDDLAGFKTVYFKARNGTINATTPAFAIILYVGSPTDMSIIINDRATSTASRSVTLIMWASGAEEMCFSNDGTAWSAWETFTTTKSWRLVGGPGSKIVYFMARNIYHESNISAIIAYTIPPTGLYININGGAGETTTRAVTLTLSATGATHMCFSNDGVAWSVWESFATTKAWNLSTTAGYKTVYFKTCNDTIESAGPVVASITYTASGQSETDMPAWAWVILIAVLIEGVAIITAIWFLGRDSHARDIPTALGGEKKTRLGLLKGKVSQLKSKIFKQDATGATTGDKQPEEKVTEVAWKPAPEPVPKPAPAPAPAKKVEAPKPTPAPAPAKKVEMPKPAPAPTPENGVEATKPAKKPAKKASKKAAKKQA